jgi:hypothetical protein
MARGHERFAGCASAPVLQAITFPIQPLSFLSWEIDDYVDLGMGTRAELTSEWQTHLSEGRLARRVLEQAGMVAGWAGRGGCDGSGYRLCCSICSDYDSMDGRALSLLV